MKISEFQKNFILHDSYFERVSVNKEKNEITFDISFATWMQVWFSPEKHDEIELLTITFKDVEYADIPRTEWGIDDSIYETELLVSESGTEGLKIVELAADDCPVITIYAKEIDVKLSRYN